MSLRSSRSHHKIRDNYVTAALRQKEQRTSESATQFQRNQAGINASSENHFSSNTQSDTNQQQNQSTMPLEKQLSSSSTVTHLPRDQQSNTSDIDDELVYQTGAAPNDLSIMAFAMEKHTLNFSPNP